MRVERAAPRAGLDALGRGAGSPCPSWVGAGRRTLREARTDATRAGAENPGAGSLCSGWRADVLSLQPRFYSAWSAVEVSGVPGPGRGWAEPPVGLGSRVGAQPGRGPLGGCGRGGAPRGGAFTRGWRGLGGANRLGAGLQARVGVAEAVSGLVGRGFAEDGRGPG